MIFALHHVENLHLLSCKFAPKRISSPPGQVLASYQNAPSRLRNVLQCLRRKTGKSWPTLKPSLAKTKFGRTALVPSHGLCPPFDFKTDFGQNRLWSIAAGDLLHMCVESAGVFCVAFRCLFQGFRV